MIIENYMLVNYHTVDSSLEHNASSLKAPSPELLSPVSLDRDCSNTTYRYTPHL